MRRRLLGEQVEEVILEVTDEFDKRFNLSKDGCSGAVALVVYDTVRPPPFLLYRADTGLFFTRLLPATLEQRMRE